MSVMVQNACAGLIVTTASAQALLTVLHLTVPAEVIPPLLAWLCSYSVLSLVSLYLSEIDDLAYRQKLEEKKES